MTLNNTCDSLSDNWEQFLEFIKKRCSATAFGNWFAPIKVLELTANEITLEIPNIFVKEYLLSNYKEDLSAFLPVNAKGEPAINFVVGRAARKRTVSEPVPLSETEVERESLSEEVKLNHNYRFDTFIDGPSNQFVKSAAMGVAARPGHSYNPLFIHGGVGLGKTHILHSIGHYIKEHNKKLVVQCITTEAFINDFVDNKDLTKKVTAMVKSSKANLKEDQQVLIDLYQMLSKPEKNYSLSLITAQEEI